MRATPPRSSFRPAGGVRGSLEHFDERSDEWFETSERHNIMDRGIGDARIIEGSKRPTMPAGSTPGRASPIVEAGAGAFGLIRRTTVPYWGVLAMSGISSACTFARQNIDVKSAGHGISQPVMQTQRSRDWPATSEQHAVALYPRGVGGSSTRGRKGRSDWPGHQALGAQSSPSSARLRRSSCSLHRRQRAQPFSVRKMLGHAPASTSHWGRTSRRRSTRTRPARPSASRRGCGP